MRLCTDPYYSFRAQTLVEERLKAMNETVVGIVDKAKMPKSTLHDLICALETCGKGYP